MSKAFVTRPAVSQRGRGRGRAHATNSEPSAGESVSSSRRIQAPPGGLGVGEGARRQSQLNSTRGGGSTRGTTRGLTGRGAPRGSPIKRGGNFNAGRSRGMEGELNQGMRKASLGNEDNPQAGEQRSTHTGSYTVISPNEKKRQQIMKQAQRETQQYEEYKQRNKPTSFSYVGTAGGGQSLSLEEARRQQVHSQANLSKTNRLLRDQERRRQQQHHEAAVLGERKMAARRQSERNAEREVHRGGNWKTEMNRVNQAFLDKLEAEATVKAPPPTQSDGPASPSGHPSPSGSKKIPARSGPPPAAPSHHSTEGAAFSTRAHVPLPSRRPRQEQSTSTPRTKPSEAGVARTSSDSTAAFVDRDEASFEYHPNRQANFERQGLDEASLGYHPNRQDDPCPERLDLDPAVMRDLELLLNMFPHFDQSELQAILEQCNGSVEQAAALLRM